MPTQTIAPMFPLTENVEQGLYEVFGIKDTTRVVDQNIKMVDIVLIIMDIDMHLIKNFVVLLLYIQHLIQ